MTSANARRRRAVLLLLAPAIMLAGCAAKRLIRRGDESLQAGRPHQAVRHYQEALEKEPDLGQDEHFQAKLASARSLAAYQDGVSLAEKGHWDGAVARLTESLRIDPDSQQAAEALKHTKQRASEALYQQALGSADQGKLDRAADELKRAMEFDPHHGGARAALDSISPAPGRTRTEAHRLYEKAIALKAQKRWLEVSNALEAAVTADPNHLPARAERRQCNDTLARAKHNYGVGSRLLAAKELDHAIAALQQALQIWPFYEEASRLLEEATARRARAEDLYKQARQAFQTGRWDESIRAAGETLKVYPSHRQARDLTQQAKLSAADEHAEAGKRLLAKGRLDEAEKQFLRSLEYRPELAAAKKGLAEVYSLRARAAEKRELWGNALLWYGEAVAHDPGEKEHAVGLARAKANVEGQVGFALNVAVNDAVLRSDLFAQILRDKPAYVTLLADKRPAREPSFSAIVRLLDVSVRDKLARTEHRVHHYTVFRAVPNPRIPELRRALTEARQDLVRLRQAYRQRCPVCKGQGKLSCKDCGGKGTVPCRDCEGTGRTKCDKCDGDGMVGKAKCTKCRGLGVVGCATCRATGERPCRSCKKRGHVPCKRCDGTGRRSRVTKSVIEQKEGRLQGLAQALAREPATITRAVEAEWPYAVLHYQRIGNLQASVQVTDVGTGAVVATKKVGKTATYSDSTTRDANPAIGLSGKALALPSEQDVRSVLVQSAAREAAEGILAAALEARISQFQATAKQLSNAGRTDEAIEAIVGSAVLMNATDPKQAAEMLRKLRQVDVPKGARPSGSQ